MDRLLASVVALLLVVTACGADSDPADTASGSGATTEPNSAADPEDSEDSEDSTDSENSADPEELYPDVVGVEAVHDGGGSWTFSVTLSSPYDSADRYADAWRVVGPDGTVYGERLLLHDHAAEQPFTRSQSGIEIPDDVTTVTVEGRDQVSGWGGATMDVTLER